MATDNSETIRDNSTSPRRASGDSGSVEQHSIQDQIAADRYYESKQASRSSKLGVKIFKIRSPGASE